jgi:hypothetical protein
MSLARLSHWEPNVNSIQIMNFDIEQLRARLTKMTDIELRQFGRAAAYMTRPRANLGKPPLQVYVVQLEEARAEWRRRYPSTTAPVSVASNP